MRSWIAAFTLTTAALASGPALADHYVFDKAHTHICFYVNHLGFSDMLGLFTEYDGSFDFDPQHPEASKIDVTLKPSGIRTTSAMLDHVLQGKDWFNTDTFPDIRFVSTAIKVTGKDTGDITGNVTMLGVTRPVVLHVRLNKVDYQPVTNLYIAGFNADATLKRSDFGMTSYVPMVGDEVRIEISTEGVDQDRKKAESLKH